MCIRDSDGQGLLAIDEVPQLGEQDVRGGDLDEGRGHGTAQQLEDEWCICFR